MSRSQMFPRLRPLVLLKRFDEYVVVYDSKYSSLDLIHPSHALLLSLCTGSCSLEQITYLVRETYELSSGEANEFVNAQLRRSRHFLEILDEPEPIDLPRYEPREFLYNIDEAQLAVNRGRPLPVPLGISLTLTLTCNFRCRYCYQNVSTDKQGRLDLTKCLELVREAADWGVTFFGITGGEPTLFKGWMTVLEQIISQGMSPLLTTNGTVIGTKQSIAQHLHAIGLRQIVVSLDASNPQLHHHITNSRNSFAKVVNAIRSLIDAGIRVAVKYVLTPLNIADLEDFLDFVIELGVSEVGISYMEAGAQGSHANLLPNLTQEQLDAARKLVLAKRGTCQGVCEIHPPRDAACTWGHSGWYPCGGLYAGMSIFPSGRVAICDKLGDVDLFTYGNVFEQSLHEIWNGDAFRELRARTVDKSRIDPDCANCSKLNLCRTGCPVDSMKAFGDYFAKHPNCGGPF